MLTKEEKIELKKKQMRIANRKRKKPTLLPVNNEIAERLKNYCYAKNLLLSEPIDEALGAFIMEKEAENGGVFPKRSHRFTYRKRLACQKRKEKEDAL